MSKRRRAPSALKTVVISGISVVLALVAWPELFSPPMLHLVRSPNPSVTRLIIDLARPANDIYEHPFMGWLFLAIVALLLIGLVIFTIRLVNLFESSRRSITTLSLSIDLEFDDALMQDSTLTRVQIFHANNKFSSAYYFKHSVTSDHGELSGEFILYSLIGDERVTKELLGPVNRRRIEVIEHYHKPLPSGLRARFLPVEIKVWLQKLGLINDLIVTRKGAIRHKNEYNGKYPHLSVSSTKNPVDNIRLSISFFEETAPNENDIHAFVISESNVEDIPISRLAEPPAGRVIYVTSVSRIQQESFQLQWKNSRLEAYIHNTQPLTGQEVAQVRTLLGTTKG